MDIALNGAAKDGFASARVVPTKLVAAGFVAEQGDLVAAIGAVI
jgi:hypothetical protein